MNGIPAGYPVIIWDFNGTILDDFGLCLQTINQMLARRGKPQISESDYLDSFDFPVQDYYRRVGFDFWTEPFPVLAAEYMDHYQPASLACPLRRGIREALAFLQDRGFCQILLSASQRDFLLEQIAHFTLGSFFQTIIALDDILGRSKVELARSWFHRQSFRPELAVLIGDTTHDYEVARSLGCLCLLVGGGHNSLGRLRRTGAPVLDEPAGLIGQINDEKGLFPGILAKYGRKGT